MSGNKMVYQSRTINKHVDPMMWHDVTKLKRSEPLHCWLCHGSITCGGVYSAPIERTTTGMYVVFGVFDTLACTKRYLLNKRNTIPEALHLLSRMAQEIYGIDEIATAPSPELLYSMCPAVEDAKFSMTHQEFKEACGDSSKRHDIHKDINCSLLKYAISVHEVIPAATIASLQENGYLNIHDPARDLNVTQPTPQEKAPSTPAEDTAMLFNISNEMDDIGDDSDAIDIDFNKLEVFDACQRNNIDFVSSSSSSSTSSRTNVEKQSRE